MMTRENLPQLLDTLGFVRDSGSAGGVRTRHFEQKDGAQYDVRVDVEQEKIIYPAAIKIGRDTTTNFSDNENFVVLECVCRLLEKGYKAEDIEIEKGVPGGHGESGGWADIIVKRGKKEGGESAGGTYTEDANAADKKEAFIIIECKTADAFDGFWRDTLAHGGQLFNYFNTFRSAQWLCLYASDLADGAVAYRSNIISVKDNEEYLATETHKPSYKSVMASGDFVKSAFNVWQKTYGSDYATRGIFEDDIEAYTPGKNKYTTQDLFEISEEEIQRKYNDFATVLRQHNVSGRENAFDKLVNLFLAKVIDEVNHTDDLYFHWKGTAFDDDFALQDRLLKLYRDGMQKFLGEEVAYVENKEIDDAFVFVKRDPDATKSTIIDLFRKLKYFSNNDFSFIEVHNESLFHQNAVILKKIVQMFENIRLKTDKSNQFLGDLFEGFLDHGVKQSEGQYFTPSPIVRFIVSSLPLESIIMDSAEVPRCIDYACGAGHFLNEYARQVAPFVRRHSEMVNQQGSIAVSQQRLHGCDAPFVSRVHDIKEYYAAITGIEKEYRLSKVSKVSALMYGEDDIQIVYGDALAENKKVKDGTYNVLVSNPPYSVSGFLETLSPEERAKYTLTNAVDRHSIPVNKAIETFFVERAAQLLAPSAIMAIILPVSILNKKGLYMKCREVLLKNFCIVAIAEFGSGTFGKTGTNTITLFARRRGKSPTQEDLYRERVSSWFYHTENRDNIYCDTDAIDKYCTHCGYSVEEYRRFLDGGDLPKAEIFEDYRRALFGGKTVQMPGLEEAKRIADDMQIRMTRKAFINLTQEEQEAEKQKTLRNFVLAAESEKVYYFMLAANEEVCFDTPQAATHQPLFKGQNWCNDVPGCSVPKEQVYRGVVVATCPAKTSEMKTYLGYEWSGRKGSEGIKYIGYSEKKEADDEESDDTMARNALIDRIKTPLFNVHNLYGDEEKINTLIRRNFDGEKVVVPDGLRQYVKYIPLVDMIDFGGLSFTKAIKTNAVARGASSGQESEDRGAVSKWESVRLGEVVSDIQTGSRPAGGVGALSDGAYSLGGEHIDNTSGYLNLIAPKYVPLEFYENAAKGKLQKGDFLICKDGALTGKVALVRDELQDKKAMINEHVFILRCNNATTQKYLFEFFRSDMGHSLLRRNVTGAAQGGLNSTNLKNIRLPLPPLPVQQRIVAECEAIDAEYSKVQAAVEGGKSEIARLFENVEGERRKLGDVCTAINPSRADIHDIPDDTVVSFVEMASLGKGCIEQKVDRPIGELRKGGYTYFRDDDLIIAKITPCMENGKCTVATGLTNGIGMGSTEFHVFRTDNIITTKFLFHYLNRDEIRNEAVLAMTGASGHRRVPEDFYRSMSIPLPPLAVQSALVAQAQAIEELIARAQEVMAGAENRRRAVLARELY